MPWVEVTRYEFHCDRCAKPYPYEDWGPATFTSKENIPRAWELAEVGWTEIGDQYFCEECWHWCVEQDEEEYVPGRKEDCCNQLEAWLDLQNFG